MKELLIDFIELLKYTDADLDQSPVVIPRCGHVQTIESMDGLMQMTSYYTIQEDGKISGLKSSSQPFSAGETRVCPVCCGSLRDVARYGRIVRRAILDSSAKEFLMWSQKKYCPLAQQVDLEEKQLLDTRARFVPDATPPHLRFQEAQMAGARTKIVDMIRSFPSYQNRYATILGLRNGINLYVHKVRDDEKPFTRVFDLIHAKNLEDLSANPRTLHTNMLQTRSHLLASALLMRCDLAILTDYLALRDSGTSQQKLCVDLSFCRKECKDLVSWAGAREQPRQSVEGHIFLARYAALEIAFATNTETAENLRAEANYHLDYARATIECYPNQIKNMQKEVEQARKLVSEEKKLEYEVCTDDRKAMLAAMATEFSPNRKWHTCVKGHPFTVEGKADKILETGCPHCDGDIVVPEPNPYEPTNELVDPDVGAMDPDVGVVDQATATIKELSWTEQIEENPWT